MISINGLTLIYIDDPPPMCVINLLTAPMASKLLEQLSLVAKSPTSTFSGPSDISSGTAPWPLPTRLVSIARPHGVPKKWFSWDDRDMGGS